MATDKLVYCQESRLFVTLLTAQALFTLKIRRARTQIAISCECLLGEGVLRTQAVKRSLIRSLLINGMCQFEDGTRAAGRREKRTPSLTNSTSDCAVWVRSWRTKRSGTSREMSLSMRVLSVAPREADAVGSLKVCRGGTAVGETREEGGSFIFLK